MGINNREREEEGVHGDRDASEFVLVYVNVSSSEIAWNNYTPCF